MLATLASKSVDSLNTLLRSSLAASEAYETAIRKIEREGDREAIALRVIQQEHLAHARKLRHQIVKLGGEPDGSSGAWGVLSGTIEKAATILGDGVAVGALREAEQHGVHRALQSIPDLEGNAAVLVMDTILPDLERHVEMLDAIRNLR